MEKLKLLNFVDLSIKEKEMILEWRNNPSISKWMYNNKNISLEEHLVFIESLQQRNDKLYFLVKRDEEYIGVIDFVDISKESLEMGIYTNPNLKGCGLLLLEEIVRYSFNELKVNKIFAEVFLENERAYMLYKKFGFKDIITKSINNREIKRLEFINENR